MHSASSAGSALPFLPLLPSSALSPASSAENGPIRNIRAGPFGLEPVVYLLVEIGIRHKAAIRNTFG
jgi:hypothetical protein